MLPASLTVLSVAAVGALSTGALFTDTAAVDGNSFTAGTINLSTTPVSSGFAVANMAPGDVVTKPITVKNDGSLELRYAMTSAATGALAPALTMAVKTGVTDCTNTGFATSGTSLYGAAGLGNPEAVKVFGDSRQGPDTGDRVLVAGGSEALCVQVTLPGAATGNDFQAKTANVTFTFDGEQTKNNGFETPSAPQGVGAAPAANGVTITWDPSGSAGVTGYQIVRSADRGTTWTTLATVAPDVFTYTDTTGAPGTSYTYDVLTLGGGGTTSPAPDNGGGTGNVAFPYPTLATGLGTATDVATGNDGNFYTVTDAGTLYRVTPTGTTTTVATGLGNAYNITRGNDGNLYVINYDGYLYRVTTSGTKSLVTSTLNLGAWAVTHATNGYLYATNYNNGTLYRVTTTGTTSALTSLGGIHGIAQGSDGNLYVSSNSDLYRVTTSGTKTLIASGLGWTWDLVAASDGTLHTYNNTGEVYQVTLAGAVKKIASRLGGSYGGLTQGSDGNLYVANDSNGGRLIKIAR